jgi:2-oxoglutarate dehydrogenase E2 component (dihydrolipoamide succinyltransferase)
VAPPSAELEKLVPMSALRRRVAERLVSAQQNAAILTTFNEVDMSYVMATRKKYQEAFVGRYGIKLGFMSFFVKAAIDALRAYPEINAEIQGTNILYRNHYDIGVAVGSDKGLFVPVVRRAELLSFSELEQTIADYGKRAQAGKLTLDEMTGGTFTISNGGVYGSLMSTPILNPPQSGILGMHSIVDRPVGIGGQIVLRPMMYIALSYDHRIVDGKGAVSFLKRVKECIENPERMLLEI